MRTGGYQQWGAKPANHATRVSKLVSSLTSFDLGVAMAGATFAFLPMLAVFLLFQGYFVKGITLGAVKG